jgi:hypothetical protein
MAKEYVEKGTIMAAISSVDLTAKKESNATNLWDLTVTYVATFSPFELNPANGMTFREGFEVWEEDDTSADDKLTGLVGVRDFTPTRSPETRTMRTKIDGSVLDTELGAEEIYTIARLHNLSLNVAIPAKKSQVQPIAP